VNIKEIFDIVLKLFDKKAKTKKINLKYEIGSGIPKYVITDGRRLQ